MKNKITAILAIVLMVLVSCEKKSDSSLSNSNELDLTNSVKDICGNIYHVVTIGQQVWMTENYKCSKYDTESEAYNASWLTNNTVPISKEKVYTPYYVDATDTTKWCYEQFSSIVNYEQVSKYGYLYNWSAAVGVQDGQNQLQDFTSTRQGICPNGWHVPSIDEWYILSSISDNNDAGKQLKTTSGWFNNNGTDSYGFAILPAGCAEGDDIGGIVYNAYFWTSTPIKSGTAFVRYTDHVAEHLYGYDLDKDIAFSVRCLKNGESISVSTSNQDFDYLGGTFSLIVTSNTSWTASSNQSWVQLSKTAGSGVDEITVTVAKNNSETADVAIITVSTKEGKSVNVTVNRKGLDLTNSVKDICGNIYPVVTIGQQVWMAENLRCNRYDTQSEAYAMYWTQSNSLSTHYTYVYTPYYADAAQKINWSTKEYSGNLSSEQIAKLGYLYNWAAAVGVEDGQYQTIAFNGNRQGICPNGWHIPTNDEWNTLASYTGGDKAGKQIKTTSGWYDNGNGTDFFSFAVLPAGSAEGNSISGVGKCAFFWTATPTQNYYGAYIKGSTSDSDFLYGSEFVKSYGQSVRCLKN